MYQNNWSISKNKDQWFAYEIHTIKSPELNNSFFVNLNIAGECFHQEIFSMD